MTLPIPDRDRALAAAEDAAWRFTTLLRTVDDASVNAIGEWSIGEVGAHLSHVSGIFVDIAEGGSSPVADHRRLDRAWAHMLDEDRERDPATLAARIDDRCTAVLDKARGRGWTDNLSWHGGIVIPTYSLVGLLLTELELHGLDIARARRRPWEIAAVHARLVIGGMFPLLPHFVDEDAARGFDAVFALRVRGERPVFASVSAGRATFALERDRSVDCRISADPVAYLLVGFGRTGQWGQIARGKLFAYGRKPWLGLRFANLFVTP